MNGKISLLFVLAMSAALVAGCSARDESGGSAKTTTLDTVTETGTETKENRVSRNGSEDNNTTLILIETSMGDIKAKLWADKAPITVANFLRYVDEGFYDGLIFHRVIDGFMIQGGGFTPDMRQKATHEQIKNEARADAPNARGTLAMARTGVVDSATAQFFVNLSDNDFLNHKDKTSRGFGYCAFGEVVEGMDVVDRIAKVKTGQAGSFGDVPVETVQIKSIRRAK